MKKRKLVFAVLALISFSLGVNAQSVGLKTNLFYGGYTFTPNLGLEIGLGKRTTLEISGGYNPWNLDGGQLNNKKAVHWLAQMEFRYFFCEKFNGHFIGIHTLGGMYNIGGHELPLLFGEGSKNNRFEGSALGAGVSYGYQLVLGKNWNLEFTLGLGYANLQYDKYNYTKCGKNLGSFSRDYFGPTKVGISIIYIFK